MISAKVGVDISAQASEMDRLPAPQSAATTVMPDNDAAGLEAYLRLFTRVFQEGDGADAAAWMRALEEETGAVPLWEVLFQLMCLQVPQVMHLVPAAGTPCLHLLMLSREEKMDFFHFRVM